jgi:ATP-dependent exoDNAse (exonuclease V) alpha subunit
LPDTLPNRLPATDGALDDLTQRRLSRELLGPDGVTAHSSTFRRRDLLRGICDRLPDGAPAVDIQAFTERLLNHADIVRLAGEPGLGSRFDERELFTTRELLALERQVLEAARSGKATRRGHVPPALLEITLRDQPALSVEQLWMVDQLWRSGNFIDAIMGAPGSGKTRALAAAHAGWRASRLPVLGASVKATAAAELRNGSGISATTVARLLLDADQIDPATGQPAGLPQHVVLVVDEAGMLGSRQLARLAAHVKHAQGKLVLVGDPKQLPSIEAGGLFALLAAELQAVRLTGNQRQTDPADRKALRDYRDNDIASALSSYRARGRLQIHPTAAQQRTAMITAWWNDHLAGVPSVMLAYRRRDIRALNDLARHHMITAGNLTGPELKVSDEELGERCFQAGDHVILRRNDYSLGVRNGQRGRIQQVGQTSGNLLVTVDGNPVPVLLPASYVARSLDHGYALTIHASQGLTINRTHVLGNDALFYEAGLVALSRHRDTCHLYITEDLDAEPSREHSHIPQDPLDINKRLEVSRADRAALSHTRSGR